jgi:hypothetical protein
MIFKSNDHVDEFKRVRHKAVCQMISRVTKRLTTLNNFSCCRRRDRNDENFEKDFHVRSDESDKNLSYQSDHEHQKKH